ncbi:MAG: hydroxysqualene dehydroxylase HpnE [Planctomycetaceae bacterium]|nr:hydroxysqualene dehydroxylase HpnE [Planctomycetaceae bacterium]
MACEINYAATARNARSTGSGFFLTGAGGVRFQTGQANRQSGRTAAAVLWYSDENKCLSETKLSGSSRTLAVIGGGLAGIAAAETAARQGRQPVIFERASVLGGRAASLPEPVRKVWIDNGQHLLLGCCTEMLALNRRLGLDRFFQQTDTLPFYNVQNQCWNLSASRLLPVSLQFLPALLTMPFLPFSERLKTGYLLQKLVKEDFFRANLPAKTVADWLRQHWVPQKTRDSFWDPLILSALSETADHTAAAALQKVVRDVFFAGRGGMTLHLPIVPLREIYHDAVLNPLTKLGISFRFFKRLRRLHWEKKNSAVEITAVEFSDGSTEQFDDYVFAVPAFALWKVLNDSGLSDTAERLGLNRFEPGSISTVHLWLDRPLLNGRKCGVLLGGDGQFLCCCKESDHYYTVVVSASHRILPDAEMTASGSRMLVERILEQLRAVFGCSPLRAVHARVTVRFDAVFSPGISVFANRERFDVPVGRLFSNAGIAGDWVLPDYPATLESAVRSGNLAGKDRF